MPLPMSKGELNRLGDRLIAGERASDVDLADLAVALAAYQEVLDRVRAHLRDLGFAPSSLVKTITTMTDKLRRTHRMELSRMQDLAGARFVVSDMVVQDKARDKITDFYAAKGCPYRVVDRREDPRFGYRAVHIVVRVDDMPVEIQIRTELQDTWAQIVERLADRWGRGIRYGEDPENPEDLVRSGDDLYSRRAAMVLLMSLSTLIFEIERRRQEVNTEKQELEMLRSEYEHGQGSGWSAEKLAMKIPSTTADLFGRLGERWLPSSFEDANTEDRELLEEGRELLGLGSDATFAEFLRMTEIFMAVNNRQLGSRSAELVGLEERLRDILQEVANAVDDGPKDEGVM
jgi:ppGpp synthetase/RelA/SpoT-type nucleotidyltranferase